MSRVRLKSFDWGLLSPAPVIGVDEVGRGCLAGPVVAAAVIMSAKSRRRLFRDSKQLTERRRDELFDRILNHHQWSTGFASVEEIDRVNIYHASLLAMRRAVEGLAVAVGHVVVDGKVCIPDLVAFTQTALIKGDVRCEPVSAASIVAKVTRDRFMKTLAQSHPEYGFEIHKGYGTLNHRRALARFGPTPHHRRTFKWSFEPDDGDDAFTPSFNAVAIRAPGLDASYGTTIRTHDD